MTDDLYNIEVETIDRKSEVLSKYRGKVLLIVNTASQCGFTPQYEGLETLYREYQDDGLVILGFPCNQFSRQEPGSEEEIRDFCTTRFNVTFPMHAKIEVNGTRKHPLYAHLQAEAPGIVGTHAIKWNFTKFLISRSGEVLERFAPMTKPGKLVTRIRQELDSS